MTPFLSRRLVRCPGRAAAPRCGAAGRRIQSGAAAGLLLAALVAVLLLVAALLATVTWGPHWSRQRLAATAAEALGRPVSVGAIEVSPFAGRITVSDLVVGGIVPDGNIDLDLPISGSLDDPEFSIGAVIWRAIVDVVARVVTSPFAAPASLGEEREELSRIEFAAGTARLDDASRRRLDELATALGERPDLSLEIAGVADAAADRDGLRRARFGEMLRNAKLLDIRQRDPAAVLPPLAGLRIDDDERPKLIEQLYRSVASPLPQRIDAALRQPSVDEMERRLRDEVATVSADDLRDLAQRRAQAARVYLHDRGGIATQRLFVLAPRTAAGTEGQPSIESTSRCAPDSRRDPGRPADPGCSDNRGQ